MFAIGIFGLVFTIWGKVTTPQVKADKIDALMKQHLDFITKEFADKFTGFNKELANLRDNHIHTLSEDIKITNKEISNLAILVAKLETKIDERIPRKQ